MRPGRGTRPRTRQRPAHAAAHDGQVTAVDRGRYTCRITDGTVVVAVRGGELRQTPVVVGDRVRLLGGSDGSRDELARLVSVSERRTVLRRSPDDIDPIERPVVANADLLVIVQSHADPPPQPRLVDRCLVAAYDGGLSSVVCLTKADLMPGGGRLRELYAPLGVPVVAVSRESPLDELLALLAGRVSVLFGPSGVGKSTLVNRLVPAASRAVRPVGATGLGRHVTSSVVLYDLAGGGAVVDTPGVRAFGLALVSLPRVLAAFPDLVPVAEACPPGCDHLMTPGCRLSEPGPDPTRVASLRRLLAALRGAHEH
ncbi:MAG: ribosome small subunit-dependent GTPase A [Mycobacteriales bacterium]